MKFFIFFRKLFLFILLTGGISGCKSKLPQCDSKNVKGPLKEIFFQQQNTRKQLKEKLGIVPEEIGKRKQIAYNKENKKRYCTVQMKTSKGPVNFLYSVEFHEEQKDKIWVQLMGLADVPVCNDKGVLNTINGVLKRKKLAQGEIINIRELKYDSDDLVRTCKFAVKANDKIYKYKSEIAWKDLILNQFLVEVFFDK
ncbi:MAG: hypothetical protein PF689_00125 [Deltaproteobacteria bacterium]|jgi:hypothetical protein|nr:hypothetical protein [Deltaproteobacteria bacterium]